MTPEQAAALVVAILGSIILGMILAWLLGEIIQSATNALHKRQRAQIEAELDRQSEEVRQTILSLAESLAADKDETARAMARALFLTTGRVE